MKKTLLFSGLLLAVNVLFAQWTTSGNNIYNSNSGYVGIGTTTPGFPLQVNGLIGSTGIVTKAGSVGGFSAWIQGPSGSDANIILQGNVSSNSADQAWWISGSGNYLYIGSSGGVEPSKGAINIDGSGHVGIGTLNTSGYNFNVNGTAIFDQVTVQVFSSNNPNASPWADYVFDKDYRLPSLDSLASYIKLNSHLPGIPTTAEVKNNGLDLGATQAKLLEKIEQLTLYTIDLQKQADRSRTENEKLSQLLQVQNQKFAALQQQIDDLKTALMKK
jgi:hypothetical protein